MTTPFDPNNDPPPVIKEEEVYRADLSANPDSPLPAGTTYKTKLDAAIYGAKVFYFAALVAMLLAFVIVAAKAFHSASGKSIQKLNPSETYALIGQVFYFSIFPSVLFGSILGYTTHQLATGNRIFMTVRWAKWVLVVLCVPILVPVLIFIGFQLKRRRSLFINREEVNINGPVAYASIALIFAVFGLNEWRKPDDFIGLTLGATGILYFAADCLIVNRIALWGYAGQLAPRQAKFQFTLGQLLAGTLLLAAYATGVFKLLGAI